MQNNYKGFSLFNDVEDQQLRTFNRARVLCNMAEDNTNKQKKISHNGAGLILNYFNQIPLEERALVQTEFAKQLAKAGFKVEQRI